MNRTVLAAAVCGLPAAATAQDRLMSYSLSFQEVYAGTATPVPNPDGMIEPGEGARILLSPRFSPPVGTLVQYTPPPGSGTGTVAGLASIWFDLAAETPAAGSWSNLSRSAGFAFGSAGTPVTIPGGELEVGSIAGAMAGQTYQVTTLISSANPVTNIWRGVWTPASYEPRIQTFRTRAPSGSQGQHSSVIVQYGVDPDGNPVYTAIWVPGQFGSIQIPIVPSPASGAALGTCAALFAFSRRRTGGATARRTS